MMIGFVGLSHLGIVSSIATAVRGFQIVGYDPDPEVCASLQCGDLPIHEPNLPELLASCNDKIEFSADKTRLRDCDIVYLSQDIPTDERGRSDLNTLNRLIVDIADQVASGCILVVLSQVPPGFTRGLLGEGQLALGGKDIKLYYQVETLIFGSAVARALRPERFIVGSSDPEAELPSRYGHLLSAFGCPILVMRYESAELTKMSINLCLASTISVANTLAELCEAIGADWYEVMPALRLDRRIGQHAYLTPGLGIGGGNLERDLATICRLGGEKGTDVGVSEAFIANSRHRGQWAIEAIFSHVLQHHEHPIIAVWGLAYKANTKSTKNSPALSLLKSLGHYEIRCYDPEASLDIADSKVKQCHSALEACVGADVLVIMTPWDEFVAMDWTVVVDGMVGRVCIDPYRVANKEKLRALGFQHIRLGEAVCPVEHSQINSYRK